MYCISFLHTAVITIPGVPFVPFYSAFFLSSLSNMCFFCFLFPFSLFSCLPLGRFSRLLYPLLLTVGLMSLTFPHSLGQFIAAHLTTHHQVSLLSGANKAIITLVPLPSSSVCGMAIFYPHLGLLYIPQTRCCRMEKAII